MKLFFEARVEPISRATQRMMQTRSSGIARAGLLSESGRRPQGAGRQCAIASSIQGKPCARQRGATRNTRGILEDCKCQRLDSGLLMIERARSAWPWTLTIVILISTDIAAAGERTYVP